MTNFLTFPCKRFVSLGAYLRRMGRKNRNVNKFAQRKRDRKEQEKNPQEKPADTRQHYEDIVKENEAFEEYYKGQKIVSEEVWPVFMEALRKNLPTAFRITGSKTEADTLMNLVKSEYFSGILNLKIDGKEDGEEIKPTNLPWYPGGLAWQLHLSRTDIRRNEALYKLHNFLVAETAAGGVSRQEAVSMIPPVVLDVKPHHKVLDMCAAPGSKTAQLIEFLHADEDKMPTGFVIANDVDNSRCYMLVHQAKRLNSPSIIITNHDSAVMPNLQITDPENPSATKALKFDRILCDVPCSGDATLRKNADIWQKWSNGNGNNLHGIQYRILKRGCELLAVGGRLVYSTCSFNPIENEAVLHRMLVEAGSSLRLLPATHMLPGLKYQKGMTHWRPASKDMVFYDKFEDVPERWQTVVRPQMFPPQPADAHKYGLDNCIRILPQDQDTGGFFVALIEKVAPLPWEKTEAAVKTEDEKTEDSAKPEKSEPPKKRRRMGGYREDPFVFFSGEQEDVFPSIKEFYDLKEGFDASCLLTRCFVGKKKNIYLVSKEVKDVVQKNEANIKIINTGVKTFVRCDNKNMKCPFRLSQEGLGSISQFIGPARRVRILKEDLVLVLQCDNPSKPPEIGQFSQHTQGKVKHLDSGSCVLEYHDPESNLQLTLVGWRGVQSMRAYTATPDTVHYLRLLGADYSKYERPLEADKEKLVMYSDCPEIDHEDTSEPIIEILQRDSDTSLRETIAMTSSEGVQIIESDDDDILNQNIISHNNDKEMETSELSIVNKASNVSTLRNMALKVLTDEQSTTNRHILNVPRETCELNIVNKASNVSTLRNMALKVLTDEQSTTNKHKSNVPSLKMIVLKLLQDTLGDEIEESISLMDENDLTDWLDSEEDPIDVQQSDSDVEIINVTQADVTIVDITGTDDETDKTVEQPSRKRCQDIRPILYINLALNREQRRLRHQQRLDRQLNRRMESLFQHTQQYNDHLHQNVEQNYGNSQLNYWNDDQNQRARQYGGNSERYSGNVNENWGQQNVEQNGCYPHQNSQYHWNSNQYMGQQNSYSHQTTQMHYGNSHSNNRYRPYGRYNNRTYGYPSAGGPIRHRKWYPKIKLIPLIEVKTKKKEVKLEKVEKESNINHSTGKQDNISDKICVKQEPGVVSIKTEKTD